MQAAIIRREGPLVFCGDSYMAGDHAGLMEGARRSGLRAADAGGARVIAELERAVGADHVMTDPAQVASYACDGLTGHPVTPKAVVLPATTEEVAAARPHSRRGAGVPFVARGAGTDSGGALPVADGVVIGLQRLRAVLRVDIENERINGPAELRYSGQAFELPVPGPERPDPDELATGFAEEHERRYGYRDPDAPVELVNIRVAVAVAGPSPSRGRRPRERSSAALAARASAASGPRRRVLRGEPEAGVEAEGPCIFELPEATLVLPPGWRARVDDRGTIVAERAG